MATNLAKDITSIPATAIDDIIQQFNTKAGKNLYIALTGPIGSGVKDVCSQLEIILRDYGYKQIYVIKLSDHFEKLHKKLSTNPDADNPASNKSFYARYRKKQESGNLIREKSNDPAIFAHVAISEIASKRAEYGLKNAPSDIRDKGVEAVQEFAAVEKIAFIIDQLKRPEEAKLLRQVYKDLFFLCAVVETKRSRIDNLIGEGASEAEASELIERDKKEDNTRWGQQVQNTVLESDYFHNNNNLKKTAIRAKIRRFIELIHGQNGISPTREEFGMMQAYTASLGSLCLSRQVGAAILDSEGNLLSVGRNDVPKFGGGLYESTGLENERDNRCVNYGEKECHNDKNKKQLKKVITDEIGELIKDKNLVTKVIEIIESSKIKDLIEFSRSIHAEMDAIISIARKGVKIEKGSTLFTTTFPCHMCARHIITAGIEKVVYIEPYEKSLAIDLHADSLTTKSSEMHNGVPTQVEITSFHGVSPRRYSAFFQISAGSRKEEGKAKFLEKYGMHAKEVQYVVSFLELESRCIKNLDEKTGGF